MPRFDRHHDADAACPACCAMGLEHFYQVDDVPTSSNLLMATRQEAIKWPRGDLRLAHCATCGFITNTAFDPSTQHLTARYEATQACSPTFGAFARQLARDWVDRFALRGKKILEIGCGQGEFIAMLCDLAGATGWGLDPIVATTRSGSGRVELIADKYGPKWQDLRPDFVVCRHTLEHIADVAVFLKTLREGLARGTQPAIAIEVPDNHRVMAEAAFWDMYYEHCSYFDTTSLLNALRFSGFKPTAHRLEFGGQYLIAESQLDLPAPVATPGAVMIEPFIDKCSRRLTTWNAQLGDHSGETVVWGSGSKAVGFLTTLAGDKSVRAVVDINPAKQGTFLPGSGHEIIAPAGLVEIKPSRVIVMNPIYTEEIRVSLDVLGLSPEIMPLQ